MTLTMIVELLIVLAALVISVCFPPAALVTPVGAMYLTQMITEKAFSKAIEVEKAREEKQEDEFIQSIRLRSIAQTAFVCFVLMILSAVIVDTLVAFRVQNMGVFFSFYQLFNSIIFAFFVYIVIFRYRLYKYRKEASHEE